MPVDLQVASSAALPETARLTASAEQTLRIAAEQVWASLEPDRAELCIRVVDRDEGRALNERYRGREGATNVLSFPVDPPASPAADHLLGDIVLCAPVIAVEAGEQSKSLGDHYAHLVVHGVLHLLGFDHQVPDQAEDMERKEVEVLSCLGVADPYE